MTLAFFNQFSGVNCITIYSSTLFENLKIDPTTGSAMVGIFQLLGCVIATQLNKVLGMRPIFIGGEFIMSVSHLIVAIAVGQEANTLVLVFIMVFLTVYQASQGSYFWPYIAQVSSDTSNSVASMVLWSGVLVMAIFSQTFFDDLTIVGTFYMFFAFNLVGGIFVTICMKETTGLTREQKMALYSRDDDNPNPRYSSVNRQKMDNEDLTPD